MPKIKNWKKTAEKQHGVETAWKNEKSRYEVVVKNTGSQYATIIKDHSRNNVGDIERDARFFEKKSDAMDYAIKWMKSNPMP